MVDGGWLVYGRYAYGVVYDMVYGVLCIIRRGVVHGVVDGRGRSEAYTAPGKKSLSRACKSVVLALATRDRCPGRSGESQRDWANEMSLLLWSHGGRPSRAAGATDDEISVWDEPACGRR